MLPSSLWSEPRPDSPNDETGLPHDQHVGRSPGAAAGQDDGGIDQKDGPEWRDDGPGGRRLCWSKVWMFICSLPTLRILAGQLGVVHGGIYNIV